MSAVPRIATHHVTAERSVVEEEPKRVSEYASMVSSSFSEQFVPTEPGDIACGQCVELVQLANGVGRLQLRDWLTEATRLLRTGGADAVTNPEGSPAESGFVLIECSSCSLRHHTSWTGGGSGTRWVVGRVGQHVYQGASSFQPDYPLALDNSRYYREHNMALIAGEKE